MKVKEILKFVFLSFLIVPFNTTISQPLRFSNESIEIKIYDGYAVVNGNYTFNNRSNNEIKRTLFYPFPVSQSYQQLNNIYIFSAKG